MNGSKSKESIGRGVARDFVGLLAFVVLLCGFVWGGVSRKVAEGNRLLKEGKYEEALRRYSDAQLDRPDAPEILFNMGDGFYRQKKYAEAIEAHRQSLPLAQEPLRAKIPYNIGNSLFRQGDLQGALKAYQEALDLDPTDMDAKYNIEFIQRRLKGQEEQPKEKTPSQEEEQQRQEKDQGGSGGKEGESPPEPKEEGQGTEEGSPEEKGASPREGEKRPGVSEGREISKKDAERLLGALQSEEKTLPAGSENLQERVPERPVEKDW